MEEQIKLTINSLDLTTEEKDNFYVNKIQKAEEGNLENGENILINQLILSIKNKMILISKTC